MQPQEPANSVAPCSI